MTFVLAHAGHWLASVLYILPIVVVIGVLVFTAVREKRRAAREGEVAPPDSGSA